MFPCEIRQKLIDNRFATHRHPDGRLLLGAGRPVTRDSPIREHARNTLFIYLLYLASCKCATTFLLPALGLLVWWSVAWRCTLQRGMDDADTRRRLRTAALV
jgi:hypothetical protein